jgi:polysaccharide export outer membrane protein
MSPRRRLAGAIPLCLLLLLLPSCAWQTAAPRPASSAPAAAPPAEEAPLVLPPVVQENEAFVTVEGVAWYRIGAADVLDVVLTKELAQDRVLAEVKPNGQVTLGFFEVKVAGMTTDQAGREIHRVLAPSYRQLHVEVSVKEFRSKIVSVLGEVKRDGRFFLKGKTSLLDLIAEAGGPEQLADLRAVRLLRRDGRVYHIDLLRLVADVRLRDLVMDTGDVLFVPSREEVKVFLLGDVERPGAYPFLPNMRLSQALALAGGAKETAVLESARVIRGDLRNPTVIQVDFRKALGKNGEYEDFALERNDLIVIPRSRIGDWNAFLAKVRPSIEVMTLPLAPLTQYYLLKDLVK